MTRAEIKKFLLDIHAQVSEQATKMGLEVAKHVALSDGSNAELETELREEWAIAENIAVEKALAAVDEIPDSELCIPKAREVFVDFYLKAHRAAAQDAREFLEKMKETK